jgi:serine/threonine protein phosphatase PrpC
MDWGGCPFMEDAHLVHATEREALFCVYDGHGGSAAADHCRDHLHLRILNSFGCGATPAEALVDGFARTEDELLTEQRQQLARRMSAGSTGSPCPAPELCGTTAVVALLREGSVHLAWLGDCRAVLCRGGEAVDLTRDHVLTGTAGSSERARVLAEVAPRSNRTSSPGLSPGPSPKLKPEPHPCHRAARSRAVDCLASWRWRGHSAIWTLRPAASRWG